MIVPFEYVAGTGAGQAIEDASMVIVGAALDDTIEWVRVPDEYGGHRVPIASMRAMRCPCGEHEVEALVTDIEVGDRVLAVAECTTHRAYLWLVVPRG